MNLTALTNKHMSGPVMVTDDLAASQIFNLEAKVPKAFVGLKESRIGVRT